MKQLFGLSLIILTIGITSMFAAQTGSVAGLVIDSHTNEPLVGANVYIVNTDWGDATDLNGQYAIASIEPGTYTLQASMIGYADFSVEIVVYEAIQIRQDFLLHETRITAPDVVISAGRLVEGASVSDIVLSERMIQSKEGLMEDPVKVLQTLPGVAVQGDLFSPSQMYVRGGAPEENLFMLDWAQLHFPWYLGGTKSVYNSKTIDKIEMLTGGFPPKYGNALSSVLSVTTRDGVRDNHGGELSLGIMTSEGLLEGPLTDNSSYLLTTRRTYLDLVMGEDADFPVPTFYDAGVKLAFDLNTATKLRFTGFGSFEGTEYYNPDPDPGVPGKIDLQDYVNTQTIELESILSQNLHSRAILTHTRTDADVVGGTVYDLRTVVDVVSLREDVTYKIPHNELKAGIQIDRHFDLMDGFMPLDASDTYVGFDSTGIPIDYYDFSKVHTNIGGYIQDTYDATRALSLTGGLRADHSFWGGNTDISPRLSMKYKLSEKSAIRSAWGVYYQFNSGLYLQGNSAIKSNRATHYILGFNHNFDHTLAGWIEVYYKAYDHLITVDSTGTFSNDGTGYSKGLEMFLQKRLGALTGWVSYALSQARRREYLDKQEFDFDYDQRHMATLVLEYNLTESDMYYPDVIGLNLRYATGRPYTPTLRADKDVNGNWVLTKGETNSRRYGDFHTLGLRTEWRIPVRKGLDSKIYMEIWNAYNRENEIGIDYRYGEQYPNHVSERYYYSTPFFVAGGVAFQF